MSEYQVIGKKTPKKDALVKATGAAKFVTDISQDRMLQAQILRSPLPHAKIVDIDVSKARSLPGVKAVITAADAPQTRYGTYLKDRPVFARRKVRYVGEPVAAVAAVDVDTAREALELIKVDYEELPAVFDPEEALKEGAPILHEEVESYFCLYPAIRHDNVCGYVEVSQGDPEIGFAQADHIFEDTFEVQSAHQGYIEPRVALAFVDGNGRVTLNASTQMPFIMRMQMAEALALSIGKIRVISGYVGGAFGGKTNTFCEPHVILLAQKTGRPVKYTPTREEEFLAGNPRHPAKLTVKTGVTKDGIILARHVGMTFDCGAYAHEGPGVLSMAAQLSMGPYKIPHMKAECNLVYTNKIPFGAFRGYGHPQACFAEECQMDIIADALGIDPLDIRLINAAEDGDPLPTGQHWKNVTIKQTLTAAAERFDWKNRRQNKKPNRGLGLACLGQGVGLLGSGAMIKINEDCSVDVLTGATDLGTGSDTALAQIAAEELGLPLDSVHMVTADTGTTPHDFGSVGSRVVFNAGHAVKMAAADARKQLFERAGIALGVQPEELEMKDGLVVVKADPEKSIDLFHLSVGEHFHGHGQIMGHGTYLAHGEPHDPETTKGFALGPYPTFVFGAQFCEVEVDPESGAVQVLDILSCHDVGQIINPDGVEGQIQGGVLQGLGYALSEEVLFDDQGRVTTTTFADYRMPTAADAPIIKALALEVPDAESPFGAKGVAEPPLGMTGPAVSGAVHDAVGVRMKSLPITPQKLVKALKSK